MRPGRSSSGDLPSARLVFAAALNLLSYVPFDHEPDGGMAVDTLEMAQAMRRVGLPQEQADVIAEQIAKGFRSDELATKEFVRAEIAALRTELHKELGALRHDMGQLSWKMAGMLLLQAGLVVTLMKLL